ncbi:hypothetical protein BX666DRAFT_1967703 [Dichotomocladium elegans]|nr:hypothetical protein BX666DRAFT_1967703 [Dichotomocladium elegans]
MPLFAILTSKHCRHPRIPACDLIAIVTPLVRCTFSPRCTSSDSASRMLLFFTTAWHLTGIESTSFSQTSWQYDAIPDDEHLPARQHSRLSISALSFHQVVSIPRTTEESGFSSAGCIFRASTILYRRKDMVGVESFAMLADNFERRSEIRQTVLICPKSSAIHAQLVFGPFRNSLGTLKTRKRSFGGFAGNKKPFNRKQ